MSDQQDQSPQPVIACNFGAIDPAERSQHGDTAEQLFAASLEIRELANGYGFRLPLEAEMLRRAAAWIANERLCCPFFTFTLVVGDALWLHLTGTDAVKAYIRSIIVDPLLQTGALPAKEEWIAAHTPKEGP